MCTFNYIFEGSLGFEVLLSYKVSVILPKSVKKY